MTTTAGATTTGPSAATTHRPAHRRIADRAFAWLAVLFVLAVLGQVYLAGLGAFGDHHGHGWFDAHETLGDALGIFAGVLFVVALVAWAGRWTVGGTLLLLVLTEVAQHGLAQAGHGNPWIGGVHAFDGMLILGLSACLAIAACRRVSRESRGSLPSAG